MPIPDLTGVQFDGRPSVFDGERDVPRRARSGQREREVIVRWGAGKRLNREGAESERFREPVGASQGILFYRW